MSLAQRLVDDLARYGEQPLLLLGSGPVSARELLVGAERQASALAQKGVGAGAVVALSVDEPRFACAALLALLTLDAIVVPLGAPQEVERARMLGLAGAEFDVTPGAVVRRSVGTPTHPLVSDLRANRHAGLILFSSGSTGEPKGIVHDWERVLKKFYDKPRKPRRTLQFLPLFHMGGLNTWLSALVFGGVTVFPSGRSPTDVAVAIERGRVELVPSTPSFLSMLVAVGAHRDRDFSAVQLVTYGAEVAPEGLLGRLRPAFPNAVFQQTYGLSEVGVLRTQSKGPDSLWVRVGGDGYDVRVVDGRLHVRTEYSMLGYLNAPSPFDPDGWLNTGDVVIQDGDWLRILGRASDLINVAGEKVFPQEIEAVLLDAENVIGAACYGERDAILGWRVAAKVVLERPEDPVALRERLRALCLSRLAKYKVPVRFIPVRSCTDDNAIKTKRSST